MLSFSGNNNLGISSSEGQINFVVLQIDTENSASGRRCVGDFVHIGKMEIGVDKAQWFSYILHGIFRSAGVAKVT